MGVKTNQLLPKVTMLVALMIAGAAAMARTAEAESIRIVAVDTLDQGTAAEGTTTDLGIDLSQGICGEVPNEPMSRSTTRSWEYRFGTLFPRRSIFGKCVISCRLRPEDEKCFRV